MGVYASAPEKRAPKEKLLDGVRRALARDAREREERARQHQLLGRFDALSQRELEVLAHVVQGRLNTPIAADLGIHERTVKLRVAGVQGGPGDRGLDVTLSARTP